MTDSGPTQPESSDSDNTTTTPPGEAANGQIGRVSSEVNQAGHQAAMDNSSKWSVPTLAGRAEATDSLTEKWKPVAGQADDAEAEPELRISTILGPLPRRASARQTRDLNDSVHHILVIGLAVSSVLLLTGLLLAFLESQTLPSETLSFTTALQQALALEPSGFLSLGLLALIVTPVIRVIGSVIVFVWERDWLFTGVTLLVFTVMVISVLVGGR